MDTVENGGKDAEKNLIFALRPKQTARMRKGTLSLPYDKNNGKDAGKSALSLPYTTRPCNPHPFNIEYAC
jgi:hypothetical protein